MTRTTAALVLVAYLLFLFTLTFFPFDGFSGSEPVDLRLQAFRTINFALRKGPGTLQFAVLIGNLLAFVPLGMLLPAITRRRSFALVFVAALGLSLVIEAGQLAVSIALGFAYRSADVDDVIVNVCGALLGYAAYVLLASVKSWVASISNASG